MQFWLSREQLVREHKLASDQPRGTVIHVFLSPSILWVTATWKQLVRQMAVELTLDVS
jgi:hypothetical protein